MPQDVENWPGSNIGWNDPAWSIIAILCDIEAHIGLKVDQNAKNVENWPGSNIGQNDLERRIIAILSDNGWKRMKFLEFLHIFDTLDVEILTGDGLQSLIFFLNVLLI